MGEYETKPVQAKAKAAATAGPAQDDRYGAGKVGSNLSARIIKVDIVDGRTRITIAQGTSHGARVGMEGYVKSAAGMLADFQLDEAREAISFANVDATPDQLRANLYVVINPTTMPRKTIAVAESTRVIAATVEGDKTKITIARGSAHGVANGMRGSLQGNLGNAGEDFTIEHTTATRSFAYVAATVDQVQAHTHVVLHPLRPASPVQCRANGAASTADVQSTANAGVAGANSRLPHFDAIQRSFGKHDISGIQAQVGGAATEASHALGAQAYATGNRVAFSSAPDLHTAAHEAAHTIQQSRGAVGFQGLGAADDEHERHADAVADAVVAGQSAEPLLDQLAGSGGTMAVQRKTDSSLDADDLVRGRIPSGKGSIGPKQGPGPTGDPYIDHGPACEGIEHADCFLAKDQRVRLIGRVEHRIAKAGANFLLALEQVRVAKLLESDEDLPWMVTLLLDLAANFVIGKIVGAVIDLKGAQAKALSKMLDDAVAMQLPAPDTWTSRVQRAIGGIKDETIKSRTKSVVEGTKKAIVSKMQARTSRKGERLQLLKMLQTSTDAAYVALQESFAAGSSDAELVALNKSFALENHHIEMYRSALEAKVKRFEKSKAGKIGQRDERAPSGILVRRDLYVVWLEYASGVPRQLAYRHQDAGAVVMQGGRLGGEADQALPMKLEPNPAIVKRGAAPERKSIEIVPGEFVETALLRHQQMWGVAPRVERVDDREQKPSPSPSPAPAKSPAVQVPKVFNVDPNTGKSLDS